MLKGEDYMRKFDVLAIGELNADVIMSGLSTMPMAGREILSKDFSLELGSSTAICACGIARLGLRTGFLGKVGNDKLGGIVIEALKDYEINVKNIIIDKDIKTGITISLSNEADRALVTYLGSIESLSITDIDLGLLKQTRHIHVGSYFLQNKLRPGLLELFKEAKILGVTTSLDSGWDDTGVWDYGIYNVLEYTDIFLPNSVEALNISKGKDINESLDILSKLCKTIVIKDGEYGARAKSGDRIVSKDGYKVQPIDTTGAGDSFNAGFIYGFLNNMDLEECLSMGNACGAISVKNIGGATACATLDEVNSIIKGGV